MIRPLTKNDKEMYKILAKEFYTSEAVLHPIPDSHIESTFQEMMHSDRYAVGYALEQDGIMVGYALLAKTFSQEAGGMVLWLEELYVREQYRGCGLGREFFAFLEEMRGSEITRIRLEVEEENKKAVELYQKMGFNWLDYRQLMKEYPN